MKLWPLAVLLLFFLSSTTNAQQDYELSYLLVRTSTAEALAKQEEHKLRTPASTMKLLTAAATLETLGPEHTYRTVVGAQRAISRGRLRGDLELKGEADPELTEESLRSLATQLQCQGLRYVAGDILVDDGEHGWPPYGPGWAWDDVGEAYSPEVTGLALDKGVLTLSPGLEYPWLVQHPLLGEAKKDAFWVLPGREGVWVQGALPTTVAPPNSALRTGERFVEILAQHGIQVRGSVRRARAEGTVLAEHHSRPLQQLLTDAVANSDNLAMELLHRSVAGRLPRVLEGESLRRADGSGLSRYNLVSAAQLVSVLRSCPSLAHVLPGSGEGTLKNRFLDGPVAGKIRAKTGSLGNVSGLAGYLFPGTAHELTFAILVNGHLGTSSERKQLEDELVVGWCQEFDRR